MNNEIERRIREAKEQYQTAIAKAKAKDPNFGVSPIEKLIEPYLHYPVECDGMTHIIHSVLTTNNIVHQVYRGRVTVSERSIIHFWVEIEDKIIDYRLQMWFPKQPGLPTGIFKPTLYPHICYEGRAIEIQAFAIEILPLIFGS